MDPNIVRSGIPRVNLWSVNNYPPRHSWSNCWPTIIGMPCNNYSTIFQNVQCQDEVNSSHTNNVFSREIINVICLSEFTNFCNMCQYYVWTLNGRPFRFIWSRSTAFLGAMRKSIFIVASGWKELWQTTIACYDRFARGCANR